MSRNRVAVVAAAILIAVITVMEIIASARGLPHDGVQPLPSTSVSSTP